MAFFTLSLLPLAGLLLALSSDGQVVVTPEPSPAVMPVPDFDQAVSSQQAGWSAAYFRGTPNNWLVTPMDYSPVRGVWVLRATFGATASERFKITRYPDWSESYPSNDYFVTQGAGAYDITFDDSTKEITVTKVSGTVDIQFQCDKGDTFFGQSVYAAGNITELGGWDVTKAALLSPQGTYPSWRQTFPIGIGKAVEWKCVKLIEENPTSDPIYEPGPNNEFTANTPTTVFGSF